MPSYFFTTPNINRNAALQRKRIEIATFLLPAAGQFCLVPCWQTASFPGFASHPANRNICPAGICVIWAFPSCVP